MRFLPRYTADSTREVTYTSDAGHPGADYIADTNPHVGPYSCFIAMAAAVANIVPVTANLPNVQAPSGGTVKGFPDLTAVVLPVGVPFPGNFASIQLASGKVLALYGN